MAKVGKHQIHLLTANSQLLCHRSYLRFVVFPVPEHTYAYVERVVCTGAHPNPAQPGTVILPPPHCRYLLASSGASPAGSPSLARNSTRNSRKDTTDRSHANMPLPPVSYRAFLGRSSKDDADWVAVQLPTEQHNATDPVRLPTLRCGSFP